MAAVLLTAPAHLELDQRKAWQRSFSKLSPSPRPSLPSHSPMPSLPPSLLLSARARASDVPVCRGCQGAGVARSERAGDPAGARANPRRSDGTSAEHNCHPAIVTRAAPLARAVCSLPRRPGLIHWLACRRGLRGVMRMARRGREEAEAPTRRRRSPDSSGRPSPCSALWQFSNTRSQVSSIQ